MSSISDDAGNVPINPVHTVFFEHNASSPIKDAVYLRRLVSGLGAPELSPTRLATDSQSARDTSYNPTGHARLKHVDRRHFYIRDQVEDFTLRVPFVRTADNLADFFTKPLPAKTFFAMRKLIMNEPGKP